LQDLDKMENLSWFIKIQALIITYRRIRKRTLYKTANMLMVMLQMPLQSWIKWVLIN